MVAEPLQDSKERQICKAQLDKEIQKLLKWEKDQIDRMCCMLSFYLGTNKEAILAILLQQCCEVAQLCGQRLFQQLLFAFFFLLLWQDILVNKVLRCQILRAFSSSINETGLLLSGSNEPMLSGQVSDNGATLDEHMARFFIKRHLSKCKLSCIVIIATKVS